MPLRPTRLRRFVDEIIYAGERAAALTRHLLAFSRGPTSQPRVLDLHGVVAGMQPMLHRLLGDNIELILLSSPGLGRVGGRRASQMEQGRRQPGGQLPRAMPKGGKLVVETANVDLRRPPGTSLGVKPGSYVMLAVSDTRRRYGPRNPLTPL